MGRSDRKGEKVSIKQTPPTDRGRFRLPSRRTPSRMASDTAVNWNSLAPSSLFCSSSPRALPVVAVYHLVLPLEAQCSALLSKSSNIAPSLRFAAAAPKTLGLQTRLASRDLDLHPSRFSGVSAHPLRSAKPRRRCPMSTPPMLNVRREARRARLAPGHTRKRVL